MKRHDSRHFGHKKHRRGKFKRLIVLAFSFFMMFSILSACIGGGRHHRHGFEHHRGFDHHRGFERNSSQAVGNVTQESSAAVAQESSAKVTQESSANVAQPQSEEPLVDELSIVTEALERAVVNGHITSEQYNQVLGQEASRLLDIQEAIDSLPSPDTNGGAPADTNPAPQVDTSSAAQADTNNAAQANANRAQADADEFRQARYREFREDRRHGFSPIGFLIGGLLRLAFLALLLLGLLRFFGFKRGRMPLGARRRWEQAYADFWGAPSEEEVPVSSEDEDDIDRELAREKARKARQQADADAKAAKAEAAKAEAAKAEAAKAEAAKAEAAKAEATDDDDVVAEKEDDDGDDKNEASSSDKKTS